MDARPTRGGGRRDERVRWDGRQGEGATRMGGKGRGHWTGAVVRGVPVGWEG